MNTSNTVQTPEPSAPVAAAFKDLDQARATLRTLQDGRDAEVRALRRFAYKHGLTRKDARNYWRVRQPENYLALIRVELAHDRALREFRRLAMIAALTRVIDTDQRLCAQQPTAYPSSAVAA